MVLTIKPMSIEIKTGPQHSKEELEEAIKYWEKNCFTRLAKLDGKIENGFPYNLHTYESTDDNTLPLTKLFHISGGGSAADDPEVKKYLDTNEKLKIRSEENDVYIVNVPKKIAVVN